MRFSLLFVFLLSFCAIADKAHAQKPADEGDDFYGRKYALVIGNSKYSLSPLTNPANDAADIAEVLTKTGFKVTTVLDADKAAFQLALAKFESVLPQRAAVLVFYAGHAVQYQAQNFLLPVDSIGNIKRADDLFTHTILLNDILERLADRKGSVATVILDACRDSPFPNTPEISAGLSRSAAKSVAQPGSAGKRKKSGTMEGVVIAYSTSPDMTAADGVGRNSPYTKHLKAFLRRPNTALEAILKLIRIEVTKETGGRQTPWYETSINGEFYPAGRARVEFEDLMTLLVPMRPQDGSEGGGGMHNWMLSDELPDPIKWEGDELTDAQFAGPKAPYFSFENLPSFAYFRRGEVIILMDGKQTHDFKKGAAKWEISLLGARGGYTAVGLTSQVMGFGGPKIEDGFGTSSILKPQPECRNDENINGSRVFLVDMKGHIRAWLAEAYTCGAANCQADYMLFFDPDDKKGFGCK
jgi:hypothetical protein